MDEREAVALRHSVRRFDGRALEAADARMLGEAVRQANEEGDLHIQLACGELEAFSGGLARLGPFSGVANYLVLCGAGGTELEERCGYFGERLVLLAKTLGIDSCWVGLAFPRRKARYTLGPGERVVIMVALGYGTEAGRPHRSRDASRVARAEGVVPDWFASGVACALLAPTAMNQQRFHFELVPAPGPDLPRVVSSTSPGPFVHVDLGIARYHFELGAGRGGFVWA